MKRAMRCLSLAILSAVTWFSNVPSLVPFAVVWHRGELTTLGTLEGTDFSQAWGINNRGRVVGPSGQRRTRRV